MNFYWNTKKCKNTNFRQWYNIDEISFLTKTARKTYNEHKECRSTHHVQYSSSCTGLTMYTYNLVYYTYLLFLQASGVGSISVFVFFVCRRRLGPCIFGGQVMRVLIIISHYTRTTPCIVWGPRVHYNGRARVSYSPTRPASRFLQRWFVTHENARRKHYVMLFPIVRPHDEKRDRIILS